MLSKIVLPCSCQWNSIQPNLHPCWIVLSISTAQGQPVQHLHLRRNYLDLLRSIFCPQITFDLVDKFPLGSVFRRQMKGETMGRPKWLQIRWLKSLKKRDSLCLAWSLPPPPPFLSMQETGGLNSLSRWWFIVQMVVLAAGFFFSYVLARKRKIIRKITTRFSMSSTFSFF